MHDPYVCKQTGKRGRVTLLLKDPNQLVEAANHQGITSSPHISKLVPVAFYTEGS